MKETKEDTRERDAEGKEKETESGQERCEGPEDRRELVRVFYKRANRICNVSKNDRIFHQRTSP